MANNVGTIVIAPIRPGSDQDTYPAFFANEGLGGHHAVASMVDRDALPDDRRVEGMTCYTAENHITWKLVGGIDNLNWVVQDYGGTAEDEITLEFSYGVVSRVVHTFSTDVMVREVLMVVETPFDGVGAQVALGDGADPEALMPYDQNCPGMAEVFETTPAKRYASGDTIVLSVTPGEGATQGAGIFKLLI